MSIVEQVKEVMSNQDLKEVKENSDEMLKLYQEMERQGYAFKQGYTLEPTESSSRYNMESEATFSF